MIEPRRPLLTRAGGRLTPLFFVEYEGATSTILSISPRRRAAGPAQPTLTMCHTAPTGRLLAASLAVMFFALAAQAARGETFLLKSGGRIDAQQLNPGRSPVEPSQLKTDLGLKLSLTPAQVSRVVVRTDVQKQYDAEVQARPNTAAGHWDLAEWCKDAGLVTERKIHLQRVLELDPEHAQARAASK